jgi:alpha-D-xyloside xylohydrolase
MNRKTVASMALLVFACTLAARLVSAAPTPVQSARRDDRGVTISLSAGVLRLQVCNDRTIHVASGPAETLPEKKEFVVTKQWTPVPFEWREEPTRLILRTARVEVNVDRASGALTFLDAAGKTLLQEPAAGGRSITDPKIAAGQPTTYRVEQTFLSPDDERLYGLAQCQDSIWNWRGMPIELRQLNTQTALPVLVSSRGYGLFWNNASLTDFNPVDQEIQLSRSPTTAPGSGPTATEQLRPAPGRGRTDASTRAGTFTTGAAGAYVFFAKDGDRRNDPLDWHRRGLLLLLRSGS